METLKKKKSNSIAMFSVNFVRFSRDKMTDVK